MIAERWHKVGHTCGISPLDDPVLKTVITDRCQSCDIFPVFTLWHSDPYIALLSMIEMRLTKLLMLIQNFHPFKIMSAKRGSCCLSLDTLIIHVIVEISADHDWKHFSRLAAQMDVEMITENVFNLRGSLALVVVKYATSTPIRTSQDYVFGYECTTYLVYEKGYYRVKKSLI